MTVVRFAGNLVQQLVHRALQIVIAGVGHLQFIFAWRSLPTLIFRQAVTLDVFDRTLPPAHELAVVPDAQGQQDRGDFR